MEANSRRNVHLDMKKLVFYEAFKCARIKNTIYINVSTVSKEIHKILALRHSCVEKARSGADCLRTKPFSGQGLVVITIIMPTSLVLLAKRAHALMVLFLNFSLERACTHKYKLN